MEQLIITIVVASVAAIATAATQAYASKRWGTPGVARQADEQEDRLIKRLQQRLATAEADASSALTRATNAEKAAAATEARRQACEEEIGRLRRDLRNTDADLRETEAELLSLYRRIGEKPSARLSEAATRESRPYDNNREDHLDA